MEIILGDASDSQSQRWQLTTMWAAQVWWEVTGTESSRKSYVECVHEIVMKPFRIIYFGPVVWVERQVLYIIM